MHANEHDDGQWIPRLASNNPIHHCFQCAGFSMLNAVPETYMLFDAATISTTSIVSNTSEALRLSSN